MSSGAHITKSSVPADVEEAMRSFSAISEGLLKSYEALAERAERVEDELCRTNAELEAKIAELTRMGERVNQLDKMAALGTMAGGIAHEIRNPMNAIKGFAALLVREGQLEEKHERWARGICEGTTEVDAIITGMLSFADPEQLRLEEINAVALASEAVRSATEGLASDGWNIEMRVPALSFHGDRLKLRHALRNLIANAIDVQPDGGHVTIEFAQVGENARICVSDAGPGFAPDVALRATDPFFTTRAEGTGLGLALVHTIAQLHGGSFEVSPTPSPRGGATVFLTIPLVHGN